MWPIFICRGSLLVGSSYLLCEVHSNRKNVTTHRDVDNMARISEWNTSKLTRYDVPSWYLDERYWDGNCRVRRLPEYRSVEIFKIHLRSLIWTLFKGKATDRANILRLVLLFYAESVAHKLFKSLRRASQSVPIALHAFATWGAMSYTRTVLHACGSKLKDMIAVNRCSMARIYIQRVLEYLLHSEISYSLCSYRCILRGEGFSTISGPTGIEDTHQNVHSAR